MACQQLRVSRTDTHVITYALGDMIQALQFSTDSNELRRSEAKVKLKASLTLDNSSFYNNTQQWFEWLNDPRQW